MPFGEELRRLRKEKGLSQKSLADAAGVSQTFIAALETGTRPGLGADVLFRLCHVLGVPCEHFEPHLAGSVEPIGSKPAGKKRAGKK